MKDNLVEIFTDGACRGNPGPGGWGALLRCNGKSREIYGAEQHTTNNRMELTAAIRALQALTQKSKVHITTDSQYVRQGILNWVKGWKARGWVTASKTPVKNKDLWQELDELTQLHNIEWSWVRGHTGHPENELADRLANLAIDEKAW